MSEHKPRTPSLLARAEADRFGEIYLWLKRHRRRVASLHEKATAPWPTVARQMEAEGVRNEAGGPPTGHLVRKTWTRLTADFAKKELARASQPAKVPRSYRPNVEPPGRPGDNRPVPKPPGTYAEQADKRELYVGPETSAAQLAASNAARLEASTFAKPSAANGWRLTPAEVMANAERRVREMDGPRPQPIVRGKII